MVWIFGYGYLPLYVLRFKTSMPCFEPATGDEVRKIIINSPNKAFDLDPISTELLKSHKWLFYL